MASLLKIHRGYLPCNASALSTLLKQPHHHQVAAVSQLSTHIHVQWSTQCRWYHQRPGLRRGASVASTAVRYDPGLLRCASTKAVERESTEEPLQQMSLFQRFWRWLHDLDDLERWDNPPDNPAELEEREAFLNRVQTMYFSDPPQKPDLQFCRESLDMLIKYNDRVAVETLWNILPELKVEADEELTTRVKNYLKKARLEAYYE